MLTPEEKKEINYDKLSPELKKKIDAAFISPYFNTTLALFMQRYTLEMEMIENPFTIRGDSSLELTVENASEVLKEAVTARQNTETALKAAKWLVDTADDLNALQNKLTIEEKKEAEVILSGKGEDVKKRIREKHGL